LDPQRLPSFPTRRSSDLGGHRSSSLSRAPHCAAASAGQATLIVMAPRRMSIRMSRSGSGAAASATAGGVTRAGALTAMKPELLRSEEHTSELQSLAYLVC